MRIAAHGELDLVSAAQLQSQLRELRESGFEHVVLDLRQLTFMDSSGVRLIVSEDRIARTSGRGFSLIRGVPTVQRVLEVCGLSERLDFCEPHQAPAPTRKSRSRRTRLDSPNLGLAFQCYLADLRQQGRAAGRLGARRAAPR